jgi:hypothetical protein
LDWQARFCENQPCRVAKCRARMFEPEFTSNALPLLRASLVWQELGRSHHGIVKQLITQYAGHLDDSVGGIVRRFLISILA